MKRFFFAAVFAISLILAPLSSLAHAIGDATTLYLNNYHGDAIDLSATTPRKRQILLAGDNVITATGEYGLKLANSYFDIANDYSAGDHASLTINVDSTTTTANGIVTTGSLYLGADITLTINIQSALAPAETSTDSITGITTPLNEEVGATANTNIIINNPTGSFGIYTGHFGAAQFGDDVNYGYQPFLTITHKITDGYGDAFFYNDFEGNDISSTRYIIVTQPEYTFTHDRTAALGTFRFVPAVNGVSANFETTLTAGEDFTAANARIVDSLAKELSPEEYTILACIFAPTLCPFNPELFDIDTSKSEIVLADDYVTGAYHANTATTITADEPYALKITFKTTRPDFVFSKLDGVGPFSRALLNGQDVYDYVDERHTERTYVSPTEIYILAPLTVTTPRIAFTPTPEEPEEPEEDDEDEIEEIKITIPKAPNTGRQ